MTAQPSQAAVYSWDDEIGEGNANCDLCGSQWDRKQTAPVSTTEGAQGLGRAGARPAAVAGMESTW